MTGPELRSRSGAARTARNRRPARGQAELGDRVGREHEGERPAQDLGPGEQGPASKRGEEERDHDDPSGHALIVSRWTLPPVVSFRNISVDRGPGRGPASFGIMPFGVNGMYRLFYRIVLRRVPAEAAHRLAFGLIRAFGRVAGVPGAAWLLRRWLGPRDPVLDRKSVG